MLDFGVTINEYSVVSSLMYVSMFYRPQVVSFVVPVPPQVHRLTVCSNTLLGTCTSMPLYLILETVCMLLHLSTGAACRLGLHQYSRGLLHWQYMVNCGGKRGGHDVNPRMHISIYEETVVCRCAYFYKSDLFFNGTHHFWLLCAHTLVVCSVHTAV